ncbi:hypothetical protein NL676_019528 [Syzygium grande]|nr:hypothetical protein NL676_019528 [Syzygium grande]
MRNHHSRNCDPDSPTVWKREKMSLSIAKDHHYSNLFPSTRTRRIEEGRREMMEMIWNLPESSYELSLKEIVDKQLPLQENQEEEEEKFQFPSAEAESNKNQKRKMRKKVTRTLVISIISIRCQVNKKTATSRNSRSKISPRTSFEGSDQRNVDTVSRIQMSPVAGDQGSHNRDITERGTSRSKSYTSRNHDGNSFLGCWPFSRTEGKMQRLRARVF